MDRALNRSSRNRPRNGAPCAARKAARLAALALALAGALSGTLPGCARVVSPLGLAAGDLLVLDADAGPPTGAGGGPRGAERSGVLFVARARTGGGYHEAEVLAADARWLEPVDVAQLPDGSLLVLESRWAPDPGAPARGALFRLLGRDTRPLAWWTDARLRQPVALARGADGTIYVSDRSADPLGLGRPTGCVFAIPVRPDGRAGEARLAAVGPELVTPGALLVLADGRLLVLDADANPHDLHLPDGRAATPGVLYELGTDGLRPLLQPTETTSPIALLEPRPGELLLLDANHGTRPGVMGDGALFRVAGDRLELLVDSIRLGRPRALVDPAGMDVLPDGRLVVADANADPLALGEDGTGKGVYGTGPGALMVVDLAAGSVEPLVASRDFVTPVRVLRMRHAGELRPVGQARSVGQARPVSEAREPRPAAEASPR